MSDYEDYEAAIREWFDRLDSYQQQSDAAHLTDEALAAPGQVPPMPKFVDPMDRAMARSLFGSIRDAKAKSMVRIAYVSSASARESRDADEDSRQAIRAGFWSDVLDNLS